MYKSVEHAAQLLEYFGRQFALVRVFANEGVLEDVLHHHAVVGVLLHYAQNEVLGIVAHVHVLRKLHFVLHLSSRMGTMRFKSSSEYILKGIFPRMH